MSSNTITSYPTPEVGARHSHLTPLGPGGRPFSRWRGPLAGLTLVGLLVVVILLMSERAPEMVGEVTDRVSDRIVSEAPDTSARARRTLDRTGIEEKDTLAHITMWGTATVLGGLTMWSWRSLLAALVMTVVVSTGLELVQELIAPLRITELRDVAANMVGISLGAAAAIAISFVLGLPARARLRSSAGGLSG